MLWGDPLPRHVSVSVYSKGLAATMSISVDYNGLIGSLADSIRLQVPGNERNSENGILSEVLILEELCAANCRTKCGNGRV